MPAAMSFRRVVTSWSFLLVLASCGEDRPPAAPPPPPVTAPSAASATPAPAEPADEPADEPAEPEAAQEPVVEAPPPAPPPPPLVQAEVPSNEDELPVLVPELRDATRIGAGPWLAQSELAIGAGWVNFASDQTVSVVTELEHRRGAIVLATGPSRIASPSPEVTLVSLWLARIEQRTSASDEPEYRRAGAILLYDGAMESEGGLGDIPGYDCSVGASELRARDVDRDREIEVTVIATFLQPTRERWGGGGTPEECGAVAFIVGLDDWNVQASFTREYAVNALAASIEVGEVRSTTWQLRDLDGDGHADLRVVERWRFRDYFMGDWVGDDSMPESLEQLSDQRELDCPYDPGSDSWRCDPTAPPGRLLFEDPAARGSLRGRRPW